MSTKRVPVVRARARQKDRDKRRRVAMGRDTGKPPGERRSAAGGPTPAGRTRRSRRAEQGRKQGPARLCAPQSARPDQRPAPRPPTESVEAEARGDKRGISQDLPSGGHVTSKPKAPPPETLGQKGAIALAKRLEKCWHGQGFPAARLWAEPIGERFEKVGTYENSLSE
jgi:hypothetical protein